jgi:hypothetical protein
MNINNKEIEIDAEGYLVHPENWDKEVALVLAKSENITLTDAYWPIYFILSLTTLEGSVVNLYISRCINRNNHQKPTFHPLGDFLNPALE